MSHEAHAALMAARHAAMKLRSHKAYVAAVAAIVECERRLVLTLLPK